MKTPQLKLPKAYKYTVYGIAAMILADMLFGEHFMPMWLIWCLYGVMCVMSVWMLVAAWKQKCVQYFWLLVGELAACGVLIWCYEFLLDEGRKFY